MSITSRWNSAVVRVTPSSMFFLTVSRSMGLRHRHTHTHTYTSHSFPVRHGLHAQHIVTSLLWHSLTLPQCSSHGQADGSSATKVNKPPTFYGTQSFIAASTTACHHVPLSCLVCIWIHRPFAMSPWPPTGSMALRLQTTAIDHTI